MVALLTSDSIYRLPQTRSVQGESNARRSRPRHLHAVSTPGAVSPGTDAGPLAADPLVGHEAISVRAPSVATGELVAFLAVVSVAVLLVVSFRSVQGPPADASWSSLATVTASAPASADETIIAVQPGDTLWGIAGAIAPGLDRREVVQRLAERNGGSAIWAGQDMIVHVWVANL